MAIKIAVYGKGDFKQIEKALKSLPESTRAASKAIATVGASTLAAGVLIDKGMSKATGTAKSFGSEVVQLQRLTNASAEESSKWAAIFDRYNVTGPKSALIIKTVNNAIATQSKYLKAIGVETQNANGTNRTAFEVLTDLAEAYKHAEDKTKVLEAATKTLGRGYATLLPLLAGGAVTIDQLGEAAKRNGMILSQRDISDIKVYSKAVTDNTQALKGMEIQVGLASLPFETFKAKALGGTLKALNGLDPKLAKSAGAIGSLAGPSLKVAGNLMLMVAAVPYVQVGFQVIKAQSLQAAAGMNTATLATSALLAKLLLVPFLAVESVKVMANIGHWGESQEKQWQRAYNASFAAKPIIAFQAQMLGVTIDTDNKTRTLAASTEYLSQVEQERSVMLAAGIAATQAATAETQRLKDAKLALKAAHTSERDSEIAAIEAKLNDRQAQKDLAAAKRKYKDDSPEYRLAVLQAAKAHQDAKDATAAHKREIAKEKEAEKNASKNKAYLDYINAMETAWSDATTEARKYRAVVSSPLPGAKVATDAYIPWKPIKTSEVEKGKKGTAKAGKQVGQGFVDGIKSKNDEARTAGAGLVDSAKKGIVHRGLIKSPSRLTYKLGEQTGEGYALGVASKASRVRAAADKVTAAVQKAMEKYRDKVAALKDRSADIAGTWGLSGLPETEKLQASPVAALRKQVLAISSFKDTVAALGAAGLSKSIINELLAAGPQGGAATASALLGSGATGIAEYNSLYAQRKSLSDSLAVSELGTPKAPGSVTIAAGAVQVTMKITKDMSDKEIEKVVDKMTDSIARKLHIKMKK